MCCRETALSPREGPPLSQSALLGRCPTSLFGTARERWKGKHNKSNQIKRSHEAQSPALTSGTGHPQIPILMPEQI